ncbi:MAG: hypothetical protein ACOX2F_07205 [bacterium]
MLNRHAEKHGLSIKNLFSDLTAGAAAAQLAGQSADIFSEALLDQEKKNGCCNNSGGKNES